MEWISDGLTALYTEVGTYAFWIGLVTSIALLFIRHRMKLPKVKVVGGRSSSILLENGERLRTHCLTIRNDPYFFGYPINRDSLLVESARIYDPVKKIYEGYCLSWQDGSKNGSLKTELKFGDSAYLYICGIYGKRVHHYVGTEINSINLSDTLVELGETRILEIHINDKLNRRYRFSLQINAEQRRSFHEKIQVRIKVKTSYSDRVRLFRKGLRNMLGAFTRPNY